jgi:hypothetical protein
MNTLPEVITHPELVEAVVGQFAFMKCMAQPTDSNSDELYLLDLNDVFKKADDFFLQFTSFEEAIDTKETNLAYELGAFLAQWKHVTDVVAIQQNVHTQLK